jgi:hypothetical protein
MVGSRARSGTAASGGGFVGRHAWLSWLGMQWPGDGLAMCLVAGVTPTATDPASSAAWSCLVVAGGSSTPFLSTDHGGGLLRCWGKVADDSSTSVWLVWSPLPPMRSTGGQWYGGLPICLIKVADLGFLMCKDGDLHEARPS